MDKTPYCTYTITQENLFTSLEIHFKLVFITSKNIKIHKEYKIQLAKTINYVV